MRLPLFFKQVSCIITLSLFAPAIFAQETHVQTNPLKSDKITIQTFDWTFNDSLKGADVQMDITNKSQLEIKSVDIYITAKNKKGIMLQNVNNQTLRERNRKEIIAPNETKTLLFSKAFVNSEINTLNLVKVIVEYKNGSLEILTSPNK